MQSQVDILEGPSFPELQDIILHDTARWLVRRDSGRDLLRRMLQHILTATPYNIIYGSVSLERLKTQILQSSRESAADLSAGPPLKLHQSSELGGIFPDPPNAYVSTAFVVLPIESSSPQVSVAEQCSPMKSRDHWIQNMKFGER
ncbi:hypothetical protein B0H17DRAFT_1143347 [Mycena rosella]|uniref:Uncharacterized protein n=1 Tax=Mycena rosella TaxID=1033263 RepID=A0AAD7G6X3_MYCRO|nr:hypothetical protein B0H17DRAFT_1143347 [Mycena rosella]